MDRIEILALARALADELENKYNADLAPKWEGGTVKIEPADPGAKGYEMPINTLLHKIVMVRDNLRVLEQQINSSDSLTEGEKIKFQGYITRCYGSMTSFNTLFRKDGDKFGA